VPFQDAEDGRLVEGGFVKGVEVDRRADREGIQKLATNPGLVKSAKIHLDRAGLTFPKPTQHRGLSCPASRQQHEARRMPGKIGDRSRPCLRSGPPSVRQRHVKEPRCVQRGGPINGQDISVQPSTGDIGSQRPSLTFRPGAPITPGPTRKRIAPLHLLRPEGVHGPFTRAESLDPWENEQSWAAM
jgi:hypothetical protein